MRRRRASRRRRIYGDWQTPLDLAREVVASLADAGVDPASVVEPTCGRGAFLVAASERWPDASLRGYEIDAGHLREADAALGGSAQLREANFFVTRWESELAELPDPVLVLGNPPWVTSSELGALASGNLPEKANFKGLSGLDAITGKANFDVSEWMVLRLLHALLPRDFTLCFLCKSIVARRTMEHAALARWPLGGSLRRIDARLHFGAAVDAVALTLVRPPRRSRSELVRWPRYSSLSARVAEGALGCVEGSASPDIDAYLRTRHLAGGGSPEWRSGLKHDCAAVMEFDVAAGKVSSRAAGVVDLEERYLYPMLKGSDVAKGSWPPARAALVTQRHLGEDTDPIRTLAPKTWAYLEAHREALAGRKSSIYRHQPRFAVFGVGPYTFAPWKVAIAGLHKELSFMVVPPHRGRPVVFDDTTYFIAFESEDTARGAHAALTSELAREFFEARIFWEDKRPINKRVLQALCQQALVAHTQLPPTRRRARLERGVEAEL